MSAVIVHLWQSTWFALAAWLLTLLVRNDSARIRFGLWLAASLKFLFPFAVLGDLGHRFLWQVDNERSLLPLVQQMAAPLTTVRLDVSSLDDAARHFIVATWVLVSFGLLLRLFASWLHSRTLVRRSAPADIDALVPVRTSLQVSEPMAIGIVNPVILLPAGLAQTLTPMQLRSVIAHETGHVRRRDNLTAMLHALIEVLFWFHPLIWWIGARLLREREYACDEAVIEEGCDTESYAGALLNVCRNSIGEQSVCVSSASGGELTARIQSIMSHEDRRRCVVRRAALATVLLGCIVLPIAGGMTVFVTSRIAIAAGEQSIHRSASPAPSLVVMHEDYVYGRNVSLRELIVRAYAVGRTEVSGDAIGLDEPRYDIELRARPGAATDQRQLIADLLKQRFNVKLMVYPAVIATPSGS